MARFMKLPPGAKVLNDYEVVAPTGGQPNMVVPVTNKYGNRRSQAKDGAWFHSKKEMERYEDLLLEERAGNIRNLLRQVPYDLTINREKICRYVADFVYLERDNAGYWQTVYEDVKGHRTREFIIKRKLMKALLNIEVRES